MTKSKVLNLIAFILLVSTCNPPETPTFSSSATPQTPSTSPATAIPTNASAGFPTRTTGPTPTDAPDSDQLYSFSLDSEMIDVFWEADGSLSLTYTFTFSNDLNAAPIDFVDVYVPSQSFNLLEVSAEVEGQVLHQMEESAFFPGAVELGLGQNAIRPGQTGVVIFQIQHLQNVLFHALGDDSTVHAVFFPTWFEGDFIHGTTDLSITFHLPPDVLADEILPHPAPPGWPFGPVFSTDEVDRVTFTWNNPTANGYTPYLVGVSFPSEYIPETAIVSPDQVDAMLAVAYYVRGYELAVVSDFEQAVADFDLAIAIDPAYAPAYFSRGVILSIQGKSNLALLDFDQCIDLDPVNALAYFNRGWTYADIGEEELAMADIERALELGLDPSQEQTAENLLEELSW